MDSFGPTFTLESYAEKSLSSRLHFTALSLISS